MSLASAVTPAPLLLRADSGFCSQTLLERTLRHAAALGRRVDVLIKWNPRAAPVERIAEQRCADAPTEWTQLRPGKRQCLWQEELSAVQVRQGQEGQGPQRTLRRIYRLSERTLDKKGQKMLLPEYLLEGWTTTLGSEFSAQQVIALYRDHATHEQFHAEFKTDMDLNRLPSGKFATNHLVCALAALRRRIKTVMQEMMVKAARIISHARGWVLGISGSASGFAVFERAFGRMKTA